ncbi:MAG: ferredoxin, partial [Marivita sp. XM-24bin2]
MSIEALDTSARSVGLAVRGAFHPEPSDAAPKGTRTLILLGPDEPNFWDTFKSSPEYGDGDPHPLDRWSKRIVGSLAAPLNGTALFPYDGPPYAPFLRWADQSRESWPSPVGLLVHKTAGLFISFRAALALPHRFELRPISESPCKTCDTRPCETACPVGALAPAQDYDVPACIAHIRSPDGAKCRDGCLVRRACPVSKTF